MRRIAVLHIIKSLGRGGAEMLLPEAIKVHNQQRFEFHCIYFLPWKDQMVGELVSAGARVTCFPASNNLLILLQWRKVVRYINANQIDVVHCHLPWAGFVGRLIHRMHGFPVIYSEHNKQERYHMLTRFLNRITFNSQSAAVAVSADVALSIRRNIAVRIPIHEVLNGVNTVSFQRDLKEGDRIRATLKLPQYAILVGTVAVFRFQKRLPEWLEVFAAALASNPNLYGVIVGDGPLKDELMVFRKKMGLESRIFMPGLQSDVKPWLSAMDLYMMTSVFEGLPIALLEAMSMACPVLSTNAGGIREVVRDGIDGCLIGVDDWKSMPQVLVDMVTDRNALHQMACNARDRVSKDFSIVTLARKLELLYLSLSR